MRGANEQPCVPDHVDAAPWRAAAGTRDLGPGQPGDGFAEGHLGLPGTVHLTESGHLPVVLPLVSGAVDPIFFSGAGVSTVGHPLLPGAHPPSMTRLTG